jgi:acetyl-CoA synthetase
MIDGVSPLTQYTRYADALENYSRDALWALFDGNAETLNISHECIDRHRELGEAVRIAHSDGTDESLSFSAVADWSSRIANWLLDTGIAKGDRVAIMLEPGLAFYASLFGVMKSGAIAVPLFTLFGPRGLELRVRDCEPSLLITNSEKFDMARHSGVERVVSDAMLLELVAPYDTEFDCSTSANDMALFQYTSGTTRELPEAVQHRHRSVVTVAVAALYATGVRPTDRFMCPSSPAWGHGLAHGTLGPLGMGASVSTYAGQFKPERLLRAIDEHHITNMSAAATHYRMMRACDAASTYTFNLKKASFTGEALDSSTAAWAEETFGTPICSIYGSTEVGVILGQYPGADDLTPKRGALGRAMPGLDVAIHKPDGTAADIDEVGEIMVLRRSGWFSSKDRGHVDCDGDFFHDGRADDVIISAGWTISAREVEDALLAYEPIAEAAAIGISDAIRGQIIKAFIVLRDGLSRPTPAQVQTFVKTQLSAHAYPRKIEFVEELPKTPAGKVNRRALRERETALQSESDNG